MNKKIIFIILIVIIIAGFTAFFYYRDQIFSKEIVRFEILGQDSVKMGEEMEYTVKYKNNGNFALENPKLIFELSDNSLTEDSKLRITQDLKDVYPGTEEFVKFKARLLGKEGDFKVVKATLSYTPHGLSARYESETTFTTKIETVPITLTYDLPSRAEKGKEITYNINYFSNIDYPLENLSIKIEPVNGFNFKSATPSSLDNSEWKLSTLSKTQGGRIIIKGVIGADAGNHLSFLAKLGMWRDGNFVVIKEASQDVEVIQPLIFISQQINGSLNYVASPGETLKYRIFLRNIGPSSFNNLFVTSSIDSQAFDLSTLLSDGGQIRTSDGLIAFDARNVAGLQNLAPQQETNVSFSVKLKDSWSISDSEKNNVVIKNKVDVSGISQEFSNKVSSKLEVIQTALKNQDQYQITWQVKNYFNDVKNIKVKALLPQGATLSDVISPESEASHFSFDSQSREIVWSVGDLLAGSGTTLVFQVAAGVGALQVIGQATVSGEDQAANMVVQSVAQAINPN
ncbi:MAG: hypothetical protein A3F47_00195 [Candidatus Staskawiczbacteria bacterium RIFCSPHIGHO2_12_FULL_38_11]|uniref:DUF11 domain-containing protein n=1 Tax=Candidatus Staskawiczbacteria bacterium RIFCSPHIGHO2_12_FULL_38_11 TaxID=1802209 RepID=A0A1G2I7H4_9BACT|nr:MAG: hypothetical protein A3F47_00195 [Candidatus Staskawiczbacteria bacterium RIFCSPHIGHO2_12_FULL_38_11]